MDLAQIVLQTAIARQARETATFFSGNTVARQFERCIHLLKMSDILARVSRSDDYSFELYRASGVGSSTAEKLGAVSSEVHLAAVFRLMHGLDCEVRVFRPPNEDGTVVARCTLTLPPAATDAESHGDVHVSPGQGV